MIIIYLVIDALDNLYISSNEKDRSVRSEQTWSNIVHRFTRAEKLVIIIIILLTSGHINSDLKP